MSQSNSSGERPSQPVDPRALEGGTFLGHPKGLFLLFLVEMWERFSYYGMRGLLVLYLISVTAIIDLKPGRYTNTVEFTESRLVDGKESAQATPVTHTVDLSVTVGSSDGALPVPTPATSGTGAAITLVPLKKVSDPAKPGAFMWVEDESGHQPRTTSVQLNASSPRDSEIQGGEFGFGIRNTTEETIRVKVGVRRDKDDPRTFFLLNESSSAISTDIPPKSQTTTKEGKPIEPFNVIAQANTFQSGRNWTAGDASVLYGWYTGLAYLFPILGGILADKLIGTHRSMVIGSILITIGHVILGISGIGEWEHNATGMSLFVLGLAVIVLGTGHFKPTVSVMVGQLYPPGDPRRDGAFTIFYMGINLGAFICAFVCGTLGEKVGWHWGFGSAAVGMIFGLLLYLVGKPLYLKGIGDAPKPGANAVALGLFVGALALSGAFAFAYHSGFTSHFTDLISYLTENRKVGLGVMGALLAIILGWVGWFLSINRPEDRGPVVTIFVFMLFNAFFWIAFEQAGSSINVFTKENTDRMIGGFEVPATWFQSVNAGLIFILAPLFAATWTALGRRKLNPSQPVKIALGLLFLGVGYIFMVMAGKIAVGGAAKAGMLLIFMTYFWHTVGELCLSPTGLSYVTKAAPARFVSLLMGIWFISSFIANLGGGLVASLVEDVEQGRIQTPWSFGGKADFFFGFVIVPIGAGLIILLLTPLMKKLMRPGAD